MAHFKPSVHATCRDGRGVRRLASLAFHSQIGGAEVCLLSLHDGLDRAHLTPLVVLSEPGPLADNPLRRDIPLVFERRMQYIVRGTSSAAAFGANLRAFIGVERAAPPPRGASHRPDPRVRHARLQV